jgi:hypothetical protein
VGERGETKGGRAEEVMVSLETVQAVYGARSTRGAGKARTIMVMGFPSGVEESTWQAGIQFRTWADAM